MRQNLMKSASFKLEVMSPEVALAWLDEKGIKHEDCDTPIPILSNPVVCGKPQGMGDVTFDDYLMIPKPKSGPNPLQCWTATGDSMVGGKISEGDLLSVELGAIPNDGETVVASIDNEYTCKVFFTSRSGDYWLFPRNPKYDCILLGERDNVRIVGVVRDITHHSLPMPFRECEAILNEYLQRSQPADDWISQVEDVVGKGCHLFWAGAAWAVVYAVVRDCCHYEGTVSDFERVAMTLKLPATFSYSCTLGKVQRTIGNHPYMRLHVDKWRENGASTREIVLLGFLKRYLQ